MMPICAWEHCRKVSAKRIYVSTPNEGDVIWWKKGRDVFLCEKHYAKLLKKLQIVEDEDDSVSEG